MLGCRLDADKDVLTTAQAMWETDKTKSVSVTGSEIAGSTRLFRNGSMRDYYARNRGSVIRSDEDGRRRSGNSTIVGSDT
jgi:hypothetical protein